MSSIKTGKDRIFLDRDEIYNMIDCKTPTESEVGEILNKALKLKGLNIAEVASLLKVSNRIIFTY